MAVKIDFRAVSSQQLLRELTSANGPVGEYMRFVGGRSKAEAIKLAGQRTKRDSGEYSQGFDVRLRSNPTTGVAVDLTNKAPHAVVMERGMQPKQGDGLPASSSHNLIPITVGGRLITFRMVRKPRGKPHPGIDARNVMMDSVKAAIAAPYTPGKRV